MSARGCLTKSLPTGLTGTATCTGWALRTGSPIHSCARFGWPNGMQIVIEKRETRDMVTPTKTGQTTQGNSTPISDKELADLLWRELWEKAGLDGGLIKANIVEVFEKVLKDKRPASLEKTFDIVDWDDVGWTYFSPILDDQYKIDGPEEK